MSESSSQMTTEQHGDVTVVCLQHVEIFDDQTNEEVEKLMESVVEGTENPWLVLDMVNVQVVSSRFLGTMIAARKLVRKKEGRVVLSRMHSQMLESFRLTDLGRLFKLYDSVEEAVASFERWQASIE